MGKLRVYCLKTLNKLPIYPLGNTPSAPSVSGVVRLSIQPLQLYVSRVLVATDLSFSQVAKATRFVEDYGTQSTGVFHSEFQSRISLLLARVVTNDAVTEGSALVGVQVMVRELMMRHTTDSVDEVTTV